MLSLSGFHIMFSTVVKFFRRIISAFVFLTASSERLRKADPQRFSRLSGAVMLLSIVWGLILVCLWELTSHITWLARPGPGLLDERLVSSVICGAAITFGVSYRSAAAFIETFSGNRRLLRWFALAVLAATVATILYYAFRLSNPDRSTHLSQRWIWLWPRALCRVLLVTPVWGAWSMVVLGQFHRPDELTDGPARCFAGTAGPLSAAICLALPLAGTLIFLNFLHPWKHFVPPAVAIATAIGGGTLIVRMHGRLCRQALLAGNFLTQLGFLAAYLIVK